jgi:hypothetical protein
MNVGVVKVLFYSIEMGFGKDVFVEVRLGSIVEFGWTLWVRRRVDE